MLKSDKVNFVDELTGKLKDAKSLVLVNYSGLNVKAQQELKSKLSEVGGKMIVVKNTLLKRAGEAAKIDKEFLQESVLTGQNALVIAKNDPIAPIQVLGKFAKDGDVPKFRVGVVDGMFRDEATLKKLSALPGRDVLLGQLLGSLVSNLYGLVGTLSSPMQSLVYTLKTKADQG